MKGTYRQEVDCAVAGRLQAASRSSFRPPQAALGLPTGFGLTAKRSFSPLPGRLQAAFRPAPGCLWRSGVARLHATLYMKTCNLRPRQDPRPCTLRTSLCSQGRPVGCYTQEAGRPSAA
eukprot:13250567-Alexandrium_andersonii.AAC.1